MTSPFAFVPRVVSKYTKEWQGITRPSPSPSPDPTTDDEDEDEDGAHDEHKGKEKAIETHSKHSTIPQDIAALISLALSDYNIWHDHDLRWKLDACLQDDVSPDETGFVPINYLLRRAPFRGALPLPNDRAEPAETEVVKAVRTHASRTFEVRMRLPLPASSFASSATAPASSVWYGTGKTSRKKDVGGYEVRRRDWATLRDRPSRGWMRARWDDLTVYMEGIPPQYRSVGGIVGFTESLIFEMETGAGGTGTDVKATSCVQCITLPPHYLDKPGDMPKCKGYALVTFSTKSYLEGMLRTWPWQRRVPSPEGDSSSSSIKEAFKYGLRAISKARWEALNEEYLAYKQTLVDEIACAETAVEPTASPQPLAESHAKTKTQPRTGTQMQTTHSSPYPPDCLVFVRNIHPDTSKTVLKSLFSQAFQDQDQSEDGATWGRGLTSTAGLDYVDFNKGTDTCYLRLASPFHATRLLTYFDAPPKAQAHGLDTTGRTPLECDKPIAFERVQGKKEELYWEKVPEKVRRQAVERVMQAMVRGAGMEALESATSALSTQHNGAGGGRRKKRRREC